MGLYYLLGGPGASGVDAINGVGDLIQGILGTEYDIVGFDPRCDFVFLAVNTRFITLYSGVGRTTPAAASLFPTLPESLIHQLQDTNSPLPFITPDGVAQLYDYNLIYSDLVNTRGQSYAPFVSTTIVARDMLEITRAHGREMLQYWGISYACDYLRVDVIAHYVWQIREFVRHDICFHTAQQHRTAHCRLYVH